MGKRCTVALSHQTERNRFKVLILLGYVCKRNVCRSQAAVEGECRLRLIALLGNDECGMNYEDNTYNYRQDSSFLYFWGLSYAGLAAVIDIDEDREIILVMN